MNFTNTESDIYYILNKMSSPFLKYILITHNYVTTAQCKILFLSAFVMDKNVDTERSNTEYVVCLL